MFIFPANPTAMSTICRDGAPVALRIEHPALDMPLTVDLASPGRLGDEEAFAYGAGLDLTDGKLGNDLIAALASLPFVSQRAAANMVDTWEGFTHLDIGPLGHAG